MNNYEKLNELHELLLKGAINQAEFEQFKHQLLNETAEEKKPSNKLNPQSLKLIKRFTFLILTLVFFGIGTYNEYHEEITGDNPKRAITHGMVSGLIAGSAALIGMSIVAEFGPVVMLVGALVLGIFGGLAGNILGEEVSDAIYGNAAGGKGGDVKQGRADMSKIN